SKGVWKMPARTPIADLEDIFEVHIDEDDVDTVFGLLTKLLGNVPIVGSSAVTRGLKLTAVDSAGRRKKVSTILVERDIQGLKDIQVLKEEDDSAGKSGGKSAGKSDSRSEGKNNAKNGDKDSESSQVDGDK
ncbi:transporter associated domain-containing protein, partial [Gardnerella pickettii]